MDVTLPSSPRFEDYKRLIGQCARKAHVRLVAAGCSTTFDDVFQEMSLTFVKAARSFDPNKGVAFSTFLVRACWHNFNRWAEGELAHVATSLDGETWGEDDGEEGLHEAFADPNAVDPEAVVIASQRREKVMAKLSPLTRRFVELLESPPEPLVRELKALQARCALGRARGTGKSQAPKHVTAGFVMAVMGLNSSARARVYAELDRIMKRMAA